MHLSPSLSIPPRLEEARIAGQLIVFAGAGVSIGPPSNLMGFKDLAIEIVGGVIAFEDKDKDQLDRYLDRAKRKNVEVEQRARDILLARKGSYGPIHQHLLGIFGSADRVRLITTNFDLNFNDAARALWATPPREYVGPALPPGRDFQGIVQLHGSLAEQRDPLVLTKGAFGAAYMTDGWAARFLVGAFAQRTILFVGYSLGDPVMQYLLGALRMTDSWYAFCRDDERSLWEEHDVTPIPFAPRAPDDDYGDLHDSIKRWSWYAQASPSDHDQELRKLIDSDPSPSPVESDYVRARLRTDAGRATFFDAARSVAWFDWTATEGLLDPLLRTERAPFEYLKWSMWLLTYFCDGDSPPLIRFVRTRSLRLHPFLRYEIARHLQRVKSLPPSAVLRQLIALLVNDVEPVAAEFDVEIWLLQRLIRESCTTEALTLLEALTRVRLEPIEQLQARIEAALEDPTGAKGQPKPPALANRVRTRSAPDNLMEILEQNGLQLAALDPDGLVELGERRIADAYRLLDLGRSGGQDVDWMSIERVAIAASDQDRDRDTADVLVSLVRLGLDHWKASSPPKLLSFAQRHATSSGTLLRRLRLYAFAGCNQADADEILSLATAEKWALDLWIRPELYRLLEVHFPRAGEKARATFIDAVAPDEWWRAENDGR